MSPRPSSARSRRPAPSAEAMPQQAGAGALPARERAAVELPPVPLEEAVDEYLAHLKVERGLAQHTIEAYARDLRELSATVGERGRVMLGEITGEDLGEHLRALTDRGLVGKSRARALVAIRGLLRYFVAQRRLAADGVGAGGEAPKRTSKLPGVLGEAAVARLLAAAAGDAARAARHGDAGAVLRVGLARHRVDRRAAGRREPERRASCASPARGRRRGWCRWGKRRASGSSSTSRRCAPRWCAIRKSARCSSPIAGRR